jgi:membrane protease YdiL (CAAX protease family)
MTPAVLALPLSAVVTLVLLRRASWPRLVVEPFPNPLRRRAALALLVVVLALASFAPLIAFEVVRPEAESLGDIGFSSLFLGHALLAAFLLLWWVLAGRPRPADFLHLRIEPGQFMTDLQLGAAGGAAAWAVTMAVMAIVGTAVGAIEPEVVEPAARGEIPEVVRWIVDRSAFQRSLLILSAAVVEEAFFRSFLQTRCGIVVSSLFFMASHGSYGLPLMLVGVFTVSVVLGWIFRARNNVLPCMVAHGVFDAVQLFLILPAVVSAGA